jgi:hypothetical protein
MSKVSAQVLQPDFENMPIELKLRANWLLWKGKKIPYQTLKKPTKASPTDPSTWSTYEAAKARYELGGMLGVGTVLDGDGVTGIDLDNCVSDGCVSSQAIELLDSIGVQYIELSPSGNGLHGLFRSDMQGSAQGFIGDLSVEIYTDKRYLTMTGHVIKQGGLKFCHGMERIKERTLKRKNDVIAFSSSESSVTSVSSVSSVEFVTFTSLGYAIKVPRELIPNEEGLRNRAIFELARLAKGTEPDREVIYFKPLVLEWFKHAKPFISTQSFDTSWTDFFVAFKQVKFPKGQTLESITNNLPELSEQTPGWDLFGEKGNRLLRLCHGLQAHWGDESFFLGCRAAGEYLGIDHKAANQLLRALEFSGILLVTQKHTTSKSTRYRLNLNLG